MRILLYFFLFSVGFAACGGSKSFDLQYFQSNGQSVEPTFIVTVYSDLNSNFVQNQPAVEFNGSLLYYYGSNTAFLKNCILASGQVSLISGYHTTSNVSLNDCESFADGLVSDRVMPLGSSEDILPGTSVELPDRGVVYTLFFYNPLQRTSGTTSAPSSVISSSNRCVKIWAAEIDGKKLYKANNQIAEADIDLSSLYCFGL